eukprot:PLAT9627.1.p1 GENE.PLAT9627.1~~PLAT9627.1.p1  ORF type:complete len:317 (+),score=38.68 PLAT9627.1:47-952(+)
MELRAFSSRFNGAVALEAWPEGETALVLPTALLRPAFAAALRRMPQLWRLQWQPCGSQPSPEGASRPWSAPPSDKRAGLQAYRPLRREGAGRPSSAAPSDKRGRQPRVEGFGRPRTATPGDRTAGYSAALPSTATLLSARASTALSAPARRRRQGRRADAARPRSPSSAWLPSAAAPAKEGSGRPRTATPSDRRYAWRRSGVTTAAAAAASAAIAPAGDAYATHSAAAAGGGSSAREGRGRPRTATPGDRSSLTNAPRAPAPRLPSRRPLTAAARSPQPREGRGRPRTATPGDRRRSRRRL